MYGKLTGNKSNESLRTRLDSSTSDQDKQRSISPNLNNPFNNNSASYLSWNLNSLLGKINYLRSPIPTRFGIPSNTASGMASVFSPPLFQPPVKLKATKVYDKFSIDDLEEMQVDQDHQSDKQLSQEELKGSFYHEYISF